MTNIGDSTAASSTFAAPPSASGTSATTSPARSSKPEASNPTYTLVHEEPENAAGFWERANAFFASIGITVTAVMTDNGACYRSHAFAAALGENVKHKRTKPYHPQTNGKVERSNRTLAAEWAYATPYTSETEREAAYQAWLHCYNHHRPHTGINGQTPSERVHNLTGKYS